MSRGAGTPRSGDAIGEGRKRPTRHCKSADATEEAAA
jgi:hypothetical protein